MSYVLVQRNCPESDMHEIFNSKKLTHRLYCAIPQTEFAGSLIRWCLFLWFKTDQCKLDLRRMTGGTACSKHGKGMKWKEETLWSPMCRLRIMLQWTIKKCYVRVKTRFIWHRRDQWQALLNTVSSLRVPLTMGNFLRSRATIGFSRTLFHLASYKSVNVTWLC
jgi:hypothetical protein